jgi:hypothetical protein
LCTRSGATQNASHVVALRTLTTTKQKQKQHEMASRPLTWTATARAVDNMCDSCCAQRISIHRHFRSANEQVIRYLRAAVIKKESEVDVSKRRKGKR